MYQYASFESPRTPASSSEVLDCSTHAVLSFKRETAKRDWRSPQSPLCPAIAMEGRNPIPLTHPTHPAARLVHRHSATGHDGFT